MVQSFIGHENYVKSVTISSDGKMVVSGSYDETIRVMFFDYINLNFIYYYYF